MKYGILSTASIVPRFVKGINESKDNEVIAICSRELEKAKKMAKELNIPKYYDCYDDLLNNNDIDIIYIPTINSLHYSECKKALNHHKHVIVEKPFTLTYEEGKELFELAKNNHCFLMEAQKSVFLPVTLRLKELLDNKEIGELKYIELKAGFPGRFDYDHWMYDVYKGGGALYGSATYTIEYLSFLLDYLFKDIEGTCILSPTNSDDICNFQLKKDNILISSTISMNVALKNEAVFYGDKGYIVIPNYWKANSLDIVINDEVIHEKYPSTSEFQYEINHISECINDNLIESPIMNKEKTLSTLKLVDALYKKWNLKKEALSQ